MTLQESNEILGVAARLLALDFEPRPRAFGLKLVARVDVKFQAQNLVWGLS
jgi:hypothetical protein